VNTCAGSGILARDSQSSRGRLDNRIGAQRLLDQPVELRGLEDAPPLAGNVHALHQRLSLAAPDVGGDKVRRRLGQEAVGLRRIGALEIGTDGAARQHNA
jgi:hypothetical protein